MAQRKDSEGDREEASAVRWPGHAARYTARIYALLPRDERDVWGRAYDAMSDAELRGLAERTPDNPGSAKVLLWLDRAEGRG